MNSENLYNLELLLEYTFNDQNLLKEALTHSSKINKKKKQRNYERLEFLGDRILGFIVAEKIFISNQNLLEGDLTSIYHHYTNEDFLYNIANKLELSKFIQTQEGDNLNQNKSILADVIESIIASIYIDSSMEECKNFVHKKIFQKNNKIPIITKHPKSELQELSLKYFKTIPNYQLIKKEGPDHNPCFFIKASILNIVSIEAFGKNIQKAEEVAAQKLLPLLKKQIKNL